MGPSKCDHLTKECDCPLTSGEIVSLLAYCNGANLPSGVSPELYWRRVAFRLVSTLQDYVRRIEPEDIDRKPLICCPKCKSPNLVAPVNQDISVHTNSLTDRVAHLIGVICMQCGHKMRIRLKDRTNNDAIPDPGPYQTT